MTATPKYELTTETMIKYGVTFRRIKALRSIPRYGVNKGDLGGWIGWIEWTDRLHQAGDAWVSGNASILWFSKVGGSLGTLTAFRNKDSGITVTRGCFIGSLEEFRAAVIKTHGGTLHEKGYMGLANYIEFHFNELHPLTQGEQK